jgi:hypothetical protein
MTQTGYVISLNLRRRHLDESQRAMVAAQIEEFRHGGERQDANLHLERAAELFNASLRSVASAKKVLKDGQPELIAAREIAVSTAAEIATQAPATH